MRNLFLGIFFALFALSAFGAKLAIIDSGVDYKHKDLASKMWTNPQSKTTVDKDVYENDKHGWNFAEGNNEIIDYKYLGTFSSDIRKVVEMQAKILLGTATDDEKKWYASKKKDTAFLKEYGKWGNFVHGTHVSGISSNGVDEARLIGEKLIPTESPIGSVQEFVDNFAREHRNELGKNSADNPIVKLMLSMLAKRQADLLITVGKYTNAVGAEVANGSFGTSVAAILPLIKQLVQQFTGSEPSDADAKDYAAYMITEMITALKDFVGAAPNTLFVFAAGNDGTNNDTLPTSPANVKTSNSIAVAATLGTQSLASFTNVGEKMVEVAAPGVVINSTIPGDEYITLSGTSMAAPFVTNVAGTIKDSNHDLSPADVKKILMDTVDVKSWLKGKVTSSGIVNKRRAKRAADLTVRNSLISAIAQARREVKDVDDGRNWTRLNTQDLLVLPLPNWF